MKIELTPEAVARAVEMIRDYATICGDEYPITASEARILADNIERIAAREEERLARDVLAWDPS